MDGAVIIASGAFLALSVVALRRDRARATFARLVFLNDIDQQRAIDIVQKEIDWARSQDALSTLSDKFGQAGFLTLEERRNAKLLCWAVLGFCTIAGAAWGSLASIGAGTFFGTLGGAYLGLMAWLYFLRIRSTNYRRELLFQLPLTLEALILLAESGLGILPAIEQVVTSEDSVKKRNPVIRILRLVYELTSHGMPFTQSLELVSEASELKVLRHVLLHLDISGSEGGELVPSLRSLSDHSHGEWKLSVEQRVKRLENLVVFPVFTAVIGLMFLTAAVPLIPVMKFRDNLQSGRTTTSIATETQSFAD